MIIKGAENISPREIEEAIYRHEAVAEVAVFAVPDAVFQEEIAAAIVVKPGMQVDADEIRAHAGRFVTKFKLPKHIQFQEQLPKNSNGKILKRSLREQFPR